MTKNTPEKFAKKVLWELAGIRADLDQLLSGRVLEISRITGVPPEQVQTSGHRHCGRQQFLECGHSSEIRQAIQ